MSECYIDALKDAPLLENGIREQSVASAYCDDDEAWRRLSERFDEAVREISDELGNPIFRGTGAASEFAWFRRAWWSAVERLALWQQGDDFTFVMLELGDNTRIRMLTVGTATAEQLQSPPTFPL